MSHTPTTDDIMGGDWSTPDTVSPVRPIIDEMECHILRKESLPEELVQGMDKTLNDIQAKILRRRTALSRIQDQIGTCHTETASASSRRQHILSTGSTQVDTNLESLPTTKQGLVDPEDHGERDGNQDSRPASAAADTQETVLDSLHDNIKAIQSVILFRMNACMPSKTSSTSSVVSFSIFKEEMEILGGLLKHAIGSYKSSDDESRDILETKLIALPDQLNALFNMQIREAVEDGSDIDDEAMMDIVVENQQRTNILRDIDSIAKQVKEITRNIEDDAKSLVA